MHNFGTKEQKVVLKVVPVHRENMNRRAIDGCQAHKSGAVESEVFRPTVGPAIARLSSVAAPPCWRAMV
jgi:hypothetical protein